MKLKVVKRAASVLAVPQHEISQSFDTGSGALRKQTRPPQAQTTTCMLMASIARMAPVLERFTFIFIWSNGIKWRLFQYIGMSGRGHC
jgi:hypothetical protein